MANQLDWLGKPPFVVRNCTLVNTPFDGITYSPEHDGRRLTKQLQAVQKLMSDGRWRTLPAISRIVGAPEASVSARLRDLRKPKFGGFTVERRSQGDRTRGLFEYRLAQ